MTKDGLAMDTASSRTLGHFPGHPKQHRRELATGPGPVDTDTTLGKVRVDYGRGQDRTLKGKVPVECTIGDRPADGAVRRPDPRQTGASSVSYEWYGNNCGSGTLSVHFPP